MCKGSILAKGGTFVTDARIGEIYAIAVNQFNIGVLVPIGATFDRCVACVRTGDTLRLSGIPEALRFQYDIPAGAVDVMFFQTEDDHDDLLLFEDGLELPFGTFADLGITAAVLTIAANHADIEPTDYSRERYVDSFEGDTADGEWSMPNPDEGGDGARRDDDVKVDTNVNDRQQLRRKVFEPA